MIVFYGHGGSDNHGCEAIIRGTIDLIPDENKMLYSGNLKADEKYHLDQLLSIRADNYKYYNNPFLWLYYKKVKPGILFPRLRGDVEGTYYSVGGDNYCYPSLAEQLAVVNQRIRSYGRKTVLWGTSIEEEAIANERIRTDLSRYDLIVARETMTVELLKKYGIAGHCILMPDAAFAMKARETALPDIFSRPVVGLNLSPMVLDYSENAETVKEGYRGIVDYILKQTDCNIVLVPHVLKKNLNNNDFQTIDFIRSLIPDPARFAVADDMPADQLKYIISHCAFFVGARTHSTIAAYSSCVPTLVVGYSIKALGIAKDLFGSYEGYVADVRNMKTPETLSDAFIALYKERKRVREFLQSRMPEYLSGYGPALQYLKQNNLL